MEETTNVIETFEQPEAPEKKGIPGSTLKIIAIVAMFIDHFAAVILDDYLATVRPAFYTTQIQYFDYFLRCIGRFGFPIFCFLLIEGFIHTHNIKKYIRNLAIFALVSELPFNLAFRNSLFNLSYQNVFFTLLCGVLALAGIKYLGEDRKWSEKLNPLFYVASVILGAMMGYEVYNSEMGNFLIGFGVEIPIYFFIGIGAVIGLAVMIINGHSFDADKKNTFTVGALSVTVFTLLADFLRTDYGGWGVLTIVVMYLFKDNYKKRMAWGAFALCFASLLEVFAFLMVIPAKKYNGERGLNLKYFFYAFYPVHILLLYLTALALGFTTFVIK